VRVRLRPVCLALFGVALISLTWILTGHFDLQDQLYASDHPWIGPLFALSLWITVSSLLGLLSGWPILAAKYPALHRPKGKALVGGVSAVGLIPEHNITGLIPSEAGLYVWTMWPFALMRPAMLIPWKDIKLVEEDRFKVLKSYTLKTNSRIDVALSKKGYLFLEPFLPPYN